MSRTFNTEQAALIAGLPRGSLAQLVQRDLLSPAIGRVSGRGKSQGWTFGDILAIRVALEWRRRGVSWQALQRAILFIAKATPTDIAERPYVVFSGDRAWALPANANLNTLAGQPVLLADLRPAVAVLLRRIEVHAPAEKKKRKGRPRLAATTT